MRIASATVAGLLVFIVAGVGCGDRRSNPVGADLLNREPGGLAVDTVSLSGINRFEGLTNFVFGHTIDLRVGRMNGILFRALLRFEISPDELLQEVGADSLGALQVNALEVTLNRHTASFQKGLASIQVSRPDVLWDEFTSFVDSVQAVEVNLPSTLIPGAIVTLEGNTVNIELPDSVFYNAVVEDGGTIPIELLLGPAEADDFLAVLASRDSAGLTPELRMVYSAEGSGLVEHTVGSARDTYWAARDDGGGPGEDLLLVQSGIRYSLFLGFDTTGVDIQFGSTINFVELHLDTDDRSLVEIVSFPLVVVWIDAESGDSLVSDNRFTSILEIGQGMSDTILVLDPVMLQGWPSEAFLNNGISLRAVNNLHVAWLVAGTPWLKVFYTEPPEID